MRMRPLFGALALVAAATPLVGTGAALAAEGPHYAETGPEVAWLRTGAGSNYLLGYRGVTNLNAINEALYIGGAAYLGLPMGTSYSAPLGNVAPFAGLGGVILGFESRINDVFGWEASGLGGIGVTGGPAAAVGPALEPAIALNAALGSNVRANLQVGYLFMPTLNNFSGFTTALRLDFPVAF